MGNSDCYCIFVIWNESKNSIATINALILFVFFPGDSPLGPLYNFIAVLSTFFGIYLIQFVINNRINSKNYYILIIISTISAFLLRVLIMSIVNWITLPQDFPIGYNIPLALLPETIALIAFLNATLVLYTIPLAYIITRAVSVNINTKIWN